MFMTPSRHESLPEMLRYRRPAGSGTERAFIKRFILPLNARPDQFGNLILRIGDAPVLWSSHTDTAHHKEGMQDVVCSDNVRTAFKLGEPPPAAYKLAPNMKSSCLGADCTTGVWIMTEMVKAKIPGLYIWHREEECGGGGSTYIAKETPHLLNGINYAIAFDRKGTSSIITHQFSRCASETFAVSLAKQLPGFTADPTGIFTDTANYTRLVSECTNLSVGYSNAHAPNETQDAAFPARLLEYIKQLDISKLIAARDPSVEDTYTWMNWENNLGGNYYPTNTNLSLYNLIRDYPNEVADLLEHYGISAEDILSNIRTRLS
jgi:hypothetical protein